MSAHNFISVHLRSMNNMVFRSKVFCEGRQEILEVTDANEACHDQIKKAASPERSEEQEVRIKGPVRPMA